MSKVLIIAEAGVNHNGDIVLAKKLIDIAAEAKVDFVNFQTWITEDMIEAYVKLHELGYAKSVEVWQDGELVGGLYGIDLGHVFCGESMFSKVSNASKVAFITLVENLKIRKYKLIDCQVHNDHLESLGAREIDRNEFMEILNSHS